MGIEVKSNFDAKTIGQKILDNAERKMGRLCEEVKTGIVRRTDSGKIIEGGPMKAYSPDRIKNGRRIKGYKSWRADKGYSTRPNLTITGSMLTGIQTAVRRFSNYIEGKVYVTSDQTDKARWNQITRPWFGISKEQLRKIQEALANLYE